MLVITNGSDSTTFVHGDILFPVFSTPFDGLASGYAVLKQKIDLLETVISQILPPRPDARSLSSR
jgi:hypothetical protein